MLPKSYGQQDVVANLQRAALLTAAFALDRADLMRLATQDRLHQPYRMELCPLLPALLPLAGSHGVMSVTLSGAGPAVLLLDARAGWKGNAAGNPEGGNSGACATGVCGRDSEYAAVPWWHRSKPRRLSSYNQKVTLLFPQLLPYCYLSFVYKAGGQALFSRRGQFWGRAALAPVAVRPRRFCFCGGLHLLPRSRINCSGLKRALDDMLSQEVKEEHGRTRGL